MTLAQIDADIEHGLDLLEWAQLTGDEPMQRKVERGLAKLRRQRKLIVLLRRIW